jgi:perosamine synthetase
MRTLLPVELWDYDLKDAVRGLGAVVRRRTPAGRLEVPGLGEVLPIRSGRAAVTAALASLPLRPGARIGVPLYCCPVVFKAIETAGFEPRFLDVTPETICLSTDDVSAKAAGLDALIAVHMFGHLCDMDRLKGIMGTRPIIEDGAQSLGSKLSGRAAGTMGDIGVLSFRSGKYLSVGEGGAVVAADPALRSRLAGVIEGWPAPTPREEAGHVLKTFLRSKLRQRPLWGLLGSRIWRAYNKAVEFERKSPIVQSQILRSDLGLVRSRIRALDDMIETQRANASYFARTLDLNGGAICHEPPGAYYNRYLFPVILPSRQDRDETARILRSRGIDTLGPYRDVVAGATSRYGYRGDCPQAEDLLGRIMIIPSHHRLTSRDLGRIAKHFNEARASRAGRENA